MWCHHDRLALLLAVVALGLAGGGCGDGGSSSGTYQFTKDGWATLEKFWFAGTSGDVTPERQMCVSPYHPLRLVIGGTVTLSSNSGCIKYGGRTAFVFHEVQVHGNAADVVTWSQGVPPSS